MSSSFKVEMAANVLHAGGVIAYPTEAIWGLGCDPYNPRAVAKLLQLKQRHPAKGLILIAASMDQCEGVLSGIDSQQRQQLEGSWPGPVTWLVPDNGSVPSWVRGRNEGVAVRVSAHKLVADLCLAFGGPIVSTSANVSGRPPMKHPWQVQKAFRETLDFCLSGPLGGAHRPSEIRDLRSGQTIRQG